MKRILFTFTLLVALGLGNTYAQGNNNNVNIESPSTINPSSINTCQGVDTFNFRILNINVDTIIGGEITYYFPEGVNYVSSFVSSGYVLTELDVTDPQKPIFRIDSILPGEQPVISIVANSNCGVVGQLFLTNHIRFDDTTKVVYDSIATDNYIANNPSIITTSDISIINAQFGGEYSRTFKLEQSGNGFLTEVLFERTVGSAYSLDSLNLNGFGEIPFVVIPGSGGVDTVRVTITNPMLIAAGIADGTFDQTDTITITEFISVIDCDGNNGGQAVGYWGCGGDVCEKVNPTSVGVLFGAFAPDLIFTYHQGDELGFRPPGTYYEKAFGCNDTVQRAVLVRNIGSETATKISFDIEVTDPYSMILAGGYMWRNKITGPLMSFDSIDTISNYNSAAQISNVMYGGPSPYRVRVYMSSSDIEVGDSIYVQWKQLEYPNDYDSIPGGGCTIGMAGYYKRHSFYNMTYSDPCLKINVNEGRQGYSGSVYNRIVVGKGESPVSVFAGTTSTTVFTSNSAVLSGYQSIPGSLGAMDSSAYIDFKFSLPPGLDYAGNPSDTADPAFQLISSNGIGTWRPDTIIATDSTFIARYHIAKNPRPAGFSWTINTKISFSYDVDCNELAGCPAANPSSTIKKEIYAVLDTNCPYKFMMDCVDETDPFTIFCNFCNP
ncbi:MAG: hypothetical protein ACPGVD_09890, partial [Flavobacteriales bacterium]